MLSELASPLMTRVPHIANVAIPALTRLASGPAARRLLHGMAQQRRLPPVQQRQLHGNSGSGSGPKFNMPNDIPLPPGKYMAAAAAGGVALYLLKNSVLMTDAGITYVVQNQLTGQLDVYTEPGLHRRVPFFSSVTPYKQVITATFENDQAVTARFADTYVGMIPVTFRFKLPANKDGIRKMHREFRSEENLVTSLLMRNAANVTVITATQYTGEEFFQGGLNQFKTQLADQLQNGIYLTERKQVEIEQTDLAPVGSHDNESMTEGSRAPKFVKAKQLVWKTVPQLDDKGLLQRAENPLSQYGIDVTQVLIGDPRPEANLDRLLMDKKRLVAERIKTVQEQETSKAQARTEQLKKEIQRTKEVQDAQRQKELVVIANQREVEVAKQIAERETIEQRKMQDLAVIVKDKELAVAQAELNIQRANAQASKFAAEAIAARGKAEAEVLAAMYKAKAQNKEIFLAETQRDIATSLYVRVMLLCQSLLPRSLLGRPAALTPAPPDTVLLAQANLKDFKVEMPANVIIGAGDGKGGGGAGKLPSNLDVITGFSALGMMEKAAAMRAGAY